MILLFKLIAAHLIGDFLFQPAGWVREKEEKKLKANKFYLHLSVHLVLLMLFTLNMQAWKWIALLVLSHALIDVLKLYAQKEHTKVRWFFIDQFLHLLSIVFIWYFWTIPDLPDLNSFNQAHIWVVVCALLFLTSVSGLLIQLLLTPWSSSLEDSQEGSLKNAGKYIGILERLFIFYFVISGQWQSIGFLMAAKSVFRFGDLRESKNRKLTEYMLIGTLLSFGLAILTGVMVNYLL
jgi:hypothetical protein